MNILSADTATSINTVAVCDGVRVLAETFADCGRTHSEKLIETVDWVLREAGLSLDRIDALAISNGPGSFTGLRVGVAAWKGLAFGKQLPLVPVPTLDAMTRLNVFHDAVVCPLLDARMNEVFGALYRFEAGRRSKLTPDLVCSIDVILDRLAEIEPRGPVFFLGDGAARYADPIRTRVPEGVFAPFHLSMPRASAVAIEALDLFEQSGQRDAREVNPVYLRKSQAEEARAKKG